MLGQGGKYKKLDDLDEIEPVMTAGLEELPDMDDFEEEFPHQFEATDALLKEGEANVRWIKWSILFLFVFLVIIGGALFWDYYQGTQPGSKGNSEKAAEFLAKLNDSRKAVEAASKTANKKSHATWLSTVVRGPQMVIACFGDHEAGKTSLVDRYAYGFYEPFYNKSMGLINGLVEGWHTAKNQKGEFCIRAERVYDFEAEAAVICVDPMEEMVKIAKKIRAFSKHIREHCHNCPKMLFVTKLDLVEEAEKNGDMRYSISEITLNRWCKENDIEKWFRVSSRYDKNVNIAMHATLKAAAMGRKWDIPDHDNLKFPDKPEL